EDRAARDGRGARRADPGGGAVCPARAARAVSTVRLRHLRRGQRVERRGRTGEAAHDCGDSCRGLGMTVSLTGYDLTVEEVVRIARGRETVELAPKAVGRIEAG